MSAQKPDNPPAFPGMEYISQDGKANPAGMTLRDWFASQALAAVCNTASKQDKFTPWSEIAEIAYAAADAMLSARQKEPRP